MKTKFSVALLFNMIVAIMISTVSGINPAYIAGGGAALSTLMPKMQGVMPMAIQKEIWMNTIVEGLFADNTFLAKAINADEFVTGGKTVHIPNAGAGSGVVKNRNSFPATVETRADIDLTYDMDEFTTDPIRIPHADTVELSYNKRESIIRTDRAKLLEEVSEGILYSWMPAAANSILTTGDAIAAHTPSATGNRKAFTKNDVNSAMKAFNKQNIPQIGRYMLLDADMYSQLLDSLTTQEAQAFHAAVDVKKGVVGELYSFKIMMRSRVGVYTAAGAKKEWSTAGATDDAAAALAWHENSVCRSLGQIEVFENEKDATYYADILSFLIRAGGRSMRGGVEGLLAIRQDAAA